MLHFNQAAEAGDAEACTNMANFGSGNDAKEKVKWFRLGAEQGDPEAQYLLAEAYMHANIDNKGTTEALRYLRMAAEQGHTTAQNTLGTMYSNGQEVAQDSAEGERWFRKAADAGNAEARYNLGILVRQMKDQQALIISGCF